ncbi:MAG TPA: hypothetical protein VGD42_18535 [Lysobacter sp.]
MSHRRLALTLGGLLAVAAAPGTAQPGDAHGIRVRAACVQATPMPRLLADLSCERAMDCWGDPSALDVLDVQTGKRVGSGGNDLVYLDDAGTLRPDPPMQGTIRAVWTLGLAEPVAARRLQLVQGDETATAAFDVAADCAVLPAAAVKRLVGG